MSIAKPAPPTAEQLELDARQNQLLTKLIEDVRETSRRRITLSFAIIVIILFTIAFALTDYLGFARGWSFLAKLSSGQSVATANASTDEVYKRLAPLFAVYDDAKREWTAARDRLDILNRYIAAIDTWRSQLGPPAGNSLGAFEKLRRNLDSVSEHYPTASKCPNNSINVVSYVVGYSTMSKDANIPASLTLRLCGSTEDGSATYEFTDVARRDLSPDERQTGSEYAEILKSSSEQDVRASVDKFEELLKQDLSKTEDVVTQRQKLVEGKEASINAGLINYLNVNKVDIGQDISFILSRILLIVTLLSLAATSLKIILNEIRFTNRLNELRIASVFSQLHSDRNLFSSLYKAILTSTEIGKNDAEVGLTAKDLRDMVKAIVQGAAKRHV
jgi:hypothetical protein